MKLILARLPAGIGPGAAHIEDDRIVLGTSRAPLGIVRELVVVSLTTDKAAVGRRAGDAVGFVMIGEGRVGLVSGNSGVPDKNPTFHGVLIDSDSLSIEGGADGRCHLTARAATVGQDLPEGLRIEWRDARAGPGGIQAHLAGELGFLTRQRFPDDGEKDALASLAALQVMTGLRGSQRQSQKAQGGRITTPDGERLTPAMVKAHRDAWLIEHGGRIRGWQKDAMLTFGIKKRDTLMDYLPKAEQD